MKGSRVIETLAKSARDSTNDYGNNIQAQIDHLKTICILIEHEASISRGGFAWVNLGFIYTMANIMLVGAAAARKITQLCLATSKLCLEESKFLDSVSNFLAVTEATHCLGNPKLVPEKSQMIGQSQDCSVKLTNPDSWERLLALLRFLSRIQRHRATGFGWQKSAPWHQHSDFRALHEELETHLLRHRDTPPCPDVGDPGELHKDTNFNGLVCSLLCHCCDIELNNSFLPISMKGLGRDGGHGPHTENIDYPGAPSLFLAERKIRCQSSAVAICDCVKYIIFEQGFFKHMLILGYCCVQSLFILSYEVEWGPKPVQPKLLESVAFLRNVVIAVSKFYSQGQSWIEIIRLVQDFQLDLVQLPGTTEDAFKGYLSRFKDVSEPLCVPLNPLVFHGAPHNPAPTDDITSLYGQQSLEIPTAGKRTPSWMLDYTQHLTQYLSESEADQDAKSPSNPTSAVTMTRSELSSSTSGVIQRQVNPGAGNDEWLEETGLREQLLTQPDTVEGRAVRDSGSALEDTDVLLAQILQPSPNLNGLFSSGETVIDTDAARILRDDLLFRHNGDLNFLSEHVPFLWDNTDNGILP
ncbi:unnamed protein product [Clonostachys byssicola]|uniref:Uncharacterized protein n=1 Tax=Clonostachys byssicola TaxID=160290 RepID=A0A9N9UUA1_9HYPO|nr:unnamed protein product [Clonostachys byssicola]